MALIDLAYKAWFAEFRKVHSFLFAGKSADVLSDAIAIAYRAGLASQKLANATRQPVGEPVGYFDPDVLAHLTEGLIDPVGVLRRKPNGKSNVPVWLGSPAQAVDLGQFRPAVELMEWQERGHANPDFPVGDPKKHAEALRLLALIDSQAVGK